MLLFAVFILSVQCSESKLKKKKDIRDYNDADMARLLEQWEVIFYRPAPEDLANVSILN